MVSLMLVTVSATKMFIERRMVKIGRGAGRSDFEARGTVRRDDWDGEKT